MQLGAYLADEIGEAVVLSLGLEVASCHPGESIPGAAAVGFEAIQNGLAVSLLRAGRLQFVGITHRIETELLAEQRERPPLRFVRWAPRADQPGFRRRDGKRTDDREAPGRQLARCAEAAHRSPPRVP